MGMLQMGYMQSLFQIANNTKGDDITVTMVVKLCHAQNEELFVDQKLYFSTNTICICNA